MVLSGILTMTGSGAFAAQPAKSRASNRIVTTEYRDMNSFSFLKRAEPSSASKKTDECIESWQTHVMDNRPRNHERSHPVTNSRRNNWAWYGPQKVRLLKKTKCLLKSYSIWSPAWAARNSAANERQISSVSRPTIPQEQKVKPLNSHKEKSRNRRWNLCWVVCHWETCLCLMFCKDRSGWDNVPTQNCVPHLYLFTAECFILNFGLNANCSLMKSATMSSGILLILNNHNNQSGWYYFIAVFPFKVDLPNEQNGYLSHRL